MGTDIHVAAEIGHLDENGEIERWETIPGPIRECWCCDGTGKRVQRDRDNRLPDGSARITVLDEPCYWCCNDGSKETDPYEREHFARTYVEPGKSREQWFEDRNYFVFAVLAGVRNGRGFAGAYTHEPIEPISEPRGLPDDMDPNSLSYLSGEHSQTWVALEEITRWPWGEETECGGWVSLKELEVALANDGQPESWCGGIDGGRIRKVAATEAIRMVEAGEEDPNVYTFIRWKTKNRDRAGAFLDQMKELATLYGEHPIRLVMDFDS